MDQPLQPNQLPTEQTTKAPSMNDGADLHPQNHPHLSLEMRQQSNSHMRSQPEHEDEDLIVDTIEYSNIDNNRREQRVEIQENEPELTETHAEHLQCEQTTEGQNSVRIQGQGQGSIQLRQNNENGPNNFGKRKAFDRAKAIKVNQQENSLEGNKYKAAHVTNREEDSQKQADLNAVALVSRNTQMQHATIKSTQTNQGATATQRALSLVAHQDSKSTKRNDQQTGTAISRTSQRQSVSQAGSQEVVEQHADGTKIGHYVLEKSLGKGTFGKVKLATHLLTNEKVAIKILEKARIKDRKDIDRISREIKILKKVRHPNIIQLYEIIETDTELYLIMEYCQNGELFDYIVQHVRLHEKAAVRIFQQLICGIEYCHKFGICHRDLKPENLLLDFDKTLKIVDFGLSNMYESPNSLLKTACGSPCYAAPEMIAGKKYDGLKSDVWSSGVVLYAMVCGFLPFEDPKTSNLYKKIMAGEYKSPTFLSTDCSHFISKILVTDPDKRYSIEQIRDHPWFRQSRDKRPEGLFPGKELMPVDDEIYSRLLDDYCFDPDYTVKCIEANRHNNITTTYHLLYKQLLRAEKPYADFNRGHQYVGGSLDRAGIAKYQQQNDNPKQTEQYKYAAENPQNVPPKVVTANQPGHHAKNTTELSSVRKNEGQGGGGEENTNTHDDRHSRWVDSTRINKAGVRGTGGPVAKRGASTVVEQPPDLMSVAGGDEHANLYEVKDQTEAKNEKSKFKQEMQDEIRRLRERRSGKQKLNRLEIRDPEQPPVRKESPDEPTEVDHTQTPLILEQQDLEIQGGSQVAIKKPVNKPQQSLSKNVQIQKRAAKGADLKLRNNQNLTGIRNQNAVKKTIGEMGDSNQAQYIQEESQHVPQSAFIVSAQRRTVPGKTIKLSSQTKNTTQNENTPFANSPVAKTASPCLQQSILGPPSSFEQVDSSAQKAPTMSSFVNSNPSGGTSVLNKNSAISEAKRSQVNRSRTGAKSINSNNNAVIASLIQQQKKTAEARQKRINANRDRNDFLNQTMPIVTPDLTANSEKQAKIKIPSQKFNQVNLGVRSRKNEGQIRTSVGNYMVHGGARGVFDEPSIELENPKSYHAPNSHSKKEKVRDSNNSRASRQRRYIDNNQLNDEMTNEPDHQSNTVKKKNSVSNNNNSSQHARGARYGTLEAGVVARWQDTDLNVAAQLDQSLGVLEHTQHQINQSKMIMRKALDDLNPNQRASLNVGPQLRTESAAKVNNNYRVRTGSINVQTVNQMPVDRNSLRQKNRVANQQMIRQKGRFKQTQNLRMTTQNCETSPKQHQQASVMSRRAGSQQWQYSSGVSDRSRHSFDNRMFQNDPLLQGSLMSNASSKRGGSIGGNRQNQNAARQTDSNDYIGTMGVIQTQNKLNLPQTNQKTAGSVVGNQSGRIQTHNPLNMTQIYHGSSKQSVQQAVGQTSAHEMQMIRINPINFANQQQQQLTQSSQHGPRSNTKLYQVNPNATQTLSFVDYDMSKLGANNKSSIRSYKKVEQVRANSQLSQHSNTLLPVQDLQLDYASNARVMLQGGGQAQRAPRSVHGRHPQNSSSNSSSGIVTASNAAGPIFLSNQSTGSYPKNAILPKGTAMNQPTQSSSHATYKQSLLGKQINKHQQQQSRKFAQLTYSQAIQQSQIGQNQAQQRQQTAGNQLAQRTHQRAATVLDSHHKNSMRLTTPLGSTPARGGGLTSTSVTNNMLPMGSSQKQHPELVKTPGGYNQADLVSRYVSVKSTTSSGQTGNIALRKQQMSLGMAVAGGSKAQARRLSSGQMDNQQHFVAKQELKRKQAIEMQRHR